MFQQMHVARTIYQVSFTEFVLITAGK